MRLTPYFMMARVVTQTLLCRLAFHASDKTWFSHHVDWSRVDVYSAILIPILVTMVAAPMSLVLNLKNLKQFARTLFFLTCVAFGCVILCIFFVETRDPDITTYECVTDIYKL